MKERKEEKREILREMEWYRERIVEMVGKIESAKALRRIYIIVKTALSLE